MNCSFRVILSGAVAAHLALVGGCAARRTRLQYVLTAQTLAPPAVKTPPRVRNVGGAIRTSGACEVERGPLSLRWRRRDAILHLGPGPASAHLSEFRNEILRLEDTGCIVEGGGERVLRAVASSLKLPSREIYHARFGAYAQPGQIDLDANFRLKTVGPLLTPGAAADEVKVEATIPEQFGAITVKLDSRLVGFETAYYELRTVPEGGVRVTLVSVTQSRQGQKTTAAKPSGFAINIPGDKRYLRLIFMRNDEGESREIALLAAESRSGLNAARRRIEAASGSPEACHAEQNVLCVSPPRLSIITPELGVMVKGEPVYVPLGGTVGQALEEAGLGRIGQQRDLAGRLRVMRPWNDKLIPVTTPGSPEILLRLVLIGGEQIDF